MAARPAARPPAGPRSAPRRAAPASTSRHGVAGGRGPGRSWSSEESGGPREQHDRRREIEDRQLDLREPRDPGLPDEPDDEGADQRALEAPESADDNDDEREDKRVHTHAEHRRLARHDDSAAQPRHEAAEREGLDVDAVDIHAQRRGHAHVLRGRPQHDTEPRAVDEGPEEDRGGGAHADDEEVVGRIDRVADREAAEILEDLAGRERVRTPDEAHEVLEDHEEAEGHQELVFLGAPVEGPEERRLEDRAQDGRRECADRQEHEQHRDGRPGRHGADRPGRHVRAERVEVAVGHVHDTHDAVDETQAAGDQEEDRGVEERVDEVDEEDVHHSATRYGSTLTSGFVWFPLKTSASRTRYAPGGSLPVRSTISRPPSTSCDCPVATTSSRPPTTVQCATSGTLAFSPVGSRRSGSRTILYERPDFVTLSASASSASRSPCRSTRLTHARWGSAYGSNEPTTFGYERSRNTVSTAELPLHRVSW